MGGDQGDGLRHDNVPNPTSAKNERSTDSRVLRVSGCVVGGSHTEMVSSTLALEVKNTFIWTMNTSGQVYSHYLCSGQQGSIS